MKIQHAMGIVASLFIIGVAEAEERATFQKWHLSVGGAFNGSVRARVGLRNLPEPRAYAIPLGLTQAEAERDALNRRYGEGFIADDDMTPYSGTTENWRLPVDSYDENLGQFKLRNPYEFIDEGPMIGHQGGDRSSDKCQYGASVELAHELWIRDENEEHRRGIDFAAAFSFFFQRDIYRAQETVKSKTRVGESAYVTDVDARDTMFSYIEETDPAYRNYAQDGMYGMGSKVAIGNPALILDDIHPGDMEAPTYRDEIFEKAYRSRGDYRELEMLFMFRPWYEIKDWWRVFAEVGVGVSWGRFDSTVRGEGLFRKEHCSQWDCYGVAGLGTAFRYDDWTLGIDFLGRFLRDDFEVDGKYVDGEIRRADWGFRVMLGYEF